MSNIVVVDDSNFETEVLKADKPVVVEFGATWCGPCQRQAPILDKFASENTTVKVCTVDIDDAPNTASQLGIRSVPSLLVFESGVQVGFKVGLTSSKELGELLLKK